MYTLKNHDLKLRENKHKVCAIVQCYCAVQGSESTYYLLKSHRTYITASR